MAGQRTFPCHDDRHDDKTGNGVQLFDPDSGALRVLDSSAAAYRRTRLAKGRAGSAVPAIEGGRAPRRSDARRARMDETRDAAEAR